MNNCTRDHYPARYRATDPASRAQNAITVKAPPRVCMKNKARGGMSRGKYSTRRIYIYIYIYNEM